MQRTRTRSMRTRTQTGCTVDLWCCHILLLHWDSTFVKIQWTYLVSLQYQCLFLWQGTVGTVSGSVKATRHKLTLKSQTVPATSAPCKLNMCSAVKKRSCRHTRQDCRTSSSSDFSLSAMWTCCNILACNDDQSSTYKLYSWSLLVEILLKVCLLTRLLIASQFMLS